MNFEQIEYAVEVAKAKSITQASAKMAVTPSTISQALTRLEEELNVKLFNRTRKGVYPLEEAAHLFDQFLTVLDTLRSIRESSAFVGQGKLSLSVIPGAVPSVIRTISLIKKNHSEIKFELSEKAAMKVVQDVRDKTADLGLIAIYEEEVRKQLRGLRFFPMDSGKLFALVSRSSPLAKRKSLAPRDFAGETFILFNDEFVDPFLAEVEKACGTTNVLFRTNNSEVIGAALMQLNAVTIGHEFSFNNGQSYYKADYVKIALDMPQRDILIGWVTDGGSAANPIANLFMERHRAE